MCFEGFKIRESLSLKDERASEIAETNESESGGGPNVISVVSPALAEIDDVLPDVSPDVVPSLLNPIVDEARQTPLEPVPAPALILLPLRLPPARLLSHGVQQASVVVGGRSAAAGCGGGHERTRVPVVL